MGARVCKVCGVEKPLTTEYFQRNSKTRKDGTLYFSFIRTCKVCQNELQLPKNRARREKNRAKLAANQRLYHQSHKENDSATKKKWYAINKDKHLDGAKKRLYERRKTDIPFILKEKIAGRVWAAIKAKKGGKSIKKYFSYTMQELKEHLENQFESWMTWENYGTYRVDTWDDANPFTWTWQLDHIIPHSKFTYTSMEDQAFKDCWALSNLRPYSAKQNVIDGDRQ